MDDSRIKRVTCNCFSMPDRKEMDQFLGKALDPASALEVLVMEDAAAQKKAARQIRSTHRHLRRQKLEEGINKLKEAANDRFWSAVLSASVSVVSSAASCFLSAGSKKAEAALDSVSDWKSWTNEGLKVLDTGIQKYNPLDYSADKTQADAQKDQLASQEQGEIAQRMNEWIANVRDCENKMIDRLGSMQSSVHELNMSLARRS